MYIIKAMLASVLLMVLTLGCASTRLSLPPGTLDANEVSALFSGKTVESKLDKNDRISLTYYNPNGELRQLQKGQKRTGTWRVKKSGRICLQFAGATASCRAIIKEGPVYRKYIVKRDGNHQPIITYTSFTTGNLVD